MIKKNEVIYTLKEKMFVLNGQITGNDLPDKTLCLTFDDGPGESPADSKGPKTLELATYLYHERIRGAFFFTGLHV